MKTLKKFIAGIFLLCLMAACSKEETKKICDCNSPKPNKIIMEGGVIMNSNKELTLSFGGPANQTHIICNPIFLNNLLKQAKIKENSMVKLEVLTNRTYCPDGTKSGYLMTFIDVLSIKNDSLR
jgi:hypothetical protein